MDSPSSTADHLPPRPFRNEVWKEFLWGGLAAGFGETTMHPVDTVKTKMQSSGQFIPTVQSTSRFFEVSNSLWRFDGLRGFYRGIGPAFIGSFASGASYFGCIEVTKQCLQQRNPPLHGPLVDFFAGAAGEALGSIVYVPCEVIKIRMQMQGAQKTWNSQKASAGRGSVPEYDYYKGFLHAGRSIVNQEGYRGLYSGFVSTLARDIPFAGLLIVCYEGFAATRSFRNPSSMKEFALTGAEDLAMGGLAGGFASFLTTPMDVIKTRLQVQGRSMRYKGWVDALGRIWESEGIRGLFKGSGARIMWYVPAYALAFMSWQALRNTFGESNGEYGIDRLSVKTHASTIDVTVENIPRDPHKVSTK